MNKIKSTGESAVVLQGQNNTKTGRKKGKKGRSALVNKVASKMMLVDAKVHTGGRRGS